MQSCEVLQHLSCRSPHEGVIDDVLVAVSVQEKHRTAKLLHRLFELFHERFVRLLVPIDRGVKVDIGVSGYHNSKSFH